MSVAFDELRLFFCRFIIARVKEKCKGEKRKREKRVKKRVAIFSMKNVELAAALNFFKKLILLIDNRFLFSVY